MPKLREVASTAELMQLLESSGILRPDVLRRANEIAQETTSCRLLARRLVALDIITRWQAGQLLVGWTKLRLGKYLLRSQIGRGDFGRVFLARHTQLEREVAIKTLSRRFTQRPEIVERFLADAREVATLDHRNIFHVYDIDSDDDQFYIVMEYVQGVNLQHRVEQQGPLAVDVAARMLGQAAAGLAHAHERGVLHQNLQPTSLMIDEQGGVKIVGLGMGRLAAMRRTPAVADAGKSEHADTLAYVAPEQMTDNDRGDVRSDIYALGCSLYYGLTGQAPPPAMANAEPLEASVVEGADIAELRSDIPPDLAVVLRTMMARDPRDRYASAADVLHAVQLWAADPVDDVLPLVTPTRETASEESFDWLSKINEPGRTSQSADTQQRTEKERSATAGRLSKRSRPTVYAVVALAVVALCAGLAYWLMDLNSAPSSSSALRPSLVRPPDRARTPERAETSPGGSATSASPPVATPEAAESPAGLPPASADAEPKEMVAADSPPTKAAATGPDPKTETTPASPADPGGEKKPPVTAADTPANKEPPSPAPPLLNPFRELPTAVDLPSVEQIASAPANVEPLDLGKLDLSSSAPVKISLLGGQTAGAPGARIEVSETLAAERTGWQFVFVDDKSTGLASRPIAVMRSDAGHLQFQWDAAVAEVDGAAYLSNCVLRLVSGTFQHDLPLRKPLVGKPLEVNLKKQPERIRLKIPAPPDAKLVRFQVTAVDEPFPRSFTLTPPEPIAVDGANVRIGLGEDAESQVLLLDMKPDLKTVFEIECAVTFRLTPTAEPVVWSAKKLQLVGAQVALNQEAANQQAQRLRAMLTGLPPTDPTRAAREAELRQAEATLAECTRMTQAMTWLVQTKEAVAKGAAIHYRVFFLADDCEVELVRTGAAPE
ncbi:MAG: serine/threonine-protein kinase [Pirellulaceae bacterium]